jgi:hypothetical protein
MSEPIDSTVRGGRNAFFKDADQDRLLAMLMHLVNEHWVLTERVKSMETLLEQHCVLPEGAVENFKPGPEQNAQWAAESYGLIKAVVSAAQNIDNRNRSPE